MEGLDGHSSDEHRPSGVVAHAPSAATPATIIAYVALTVAMSGVAYAAGTIGSGSIIDNSLLSIDLKDGAAVKGVDVVADSLTGADINERVLDGIGRKLYYAALATGAAPTETLTTIAG